jgi:ABC-type dipeptide/oligopeptide/nickel transport system permease subunit
LARRSGLTLVHDGAATAQRPIESSRRGASHLEPQTIVGVLSHWRVCSAPYIAPFSPEQIGAGRRLSPPGAAHSLGADEFGADVTELDLNVREPFAHLKA